MKTLLPLLIFCATVLGAHAQTTTNLAYKITVETVTAGVTNSVNTSFRYDASGKSDATKIDGYALAFAQYRANGGQQDFGGWLKIDTTDRARAYAVAKQQADNAALLAKLTALLTANTDLLSASDLTSLNTIAAKAP